MVVLTLHRWKERKETKRRNPRKRYRSVLQCFSSPAPYIRWSVQLVVGVYFKPGQYKPKTQLMICFFLNTLRLPVYIYLSSWRSLISASVWMEVGGNNLCNHRGGGQLFDGNNGGGSWVTWRLTAMKFVLNVSQADFYYSQGQHLYVQGIRESD